MARLLPQAVTFYRQRNPLGARQTPLKEIAAQFAESRKRRGLSKVYTDSVETAMKTFLKGFPNTEFGLPSGAEVTD